MFYFLGVDYRSRDICIDKTKVKVQVWDTAGQERFRSMTSTFYNRAQGIIICFDVCNYSTFEHVRRWYDDIKRNAAPDVQIVVCGNKCDKPQHEWDVTAADIEVLAKDLELTVFMASASSALNVEDMFIALVSAIMAGKSDLKEIDGKRRSRQQPSVALSKDGDGEEKKECC